MDTAYRAFEFEGRPTPPPEDLVTVLPALLRSTRREWLLRAAVVSEPLAEAVIDAAEGLIGADVAGRSCALFVARGLGARRLVPAVGRRLFGKGWVGTADPAEPRRTLAQQGLRFIIEAVGPTRSRAYLETAMAVPELQVIAYGALAAEEPQAILPHLGDLLVRNPGLAGDVATRFALVHTEHCEAAARAVSALPEPIRIEFGRALEYQLMRISEVKRWVACRRLLFGR